MDIQPNYDPWDFFGLEAGTHYKLTYSFDDHITQTKPTHLFFVPNQNAKLVNVTSQYDLPSTLSKTDGTYKTKK